MAGGPHVEDRVSTLHFVNDVIFDTVTGEVRSPAGTVRLEPQPAALLALLAARAGALVTHDEIRLAIWGNATHVNFQQSVHYAVRHIRAALHDPARDPQIVQNVPRRGYRLKADGLVPVPSDLKGSEPVTGGSPVRHSHLLWLSAAAALATGVAILEQRPNNHHEIAVAALRTLHSLIF